MWDLIVSVPDHCLSIYFTKLNIKLYGENIPALLYVYGIKVPYPLQPLSNHITPRTAHFTTLADHASPS